MKGLEVITQNGASSKPTYKEYQKFLQTYDNKSDPSTSPPPLSTNSSTSSVPSTVSETDNVPVTFNAYLQSYGSKRYGAVKPNLPKKNVKTELFIQVKEDNDDDSLYGRKYNTLRSRRPPGKIILARQNSLNKCDSLKNPMVPAGHQVALSPPQAKQEVPDVMIYAKTAMLDELSSKPPKLHKSPSPTFKSTVEISNVPCLQPPPPPKLPDFTYNTPPISLTVRKVTPTTSPPKPQVNRPSFISEMQSKFSENALQNPRLPPHTQNGFISGKKSPPNPSSKLLNQQPKPSEVITNVHKPSSGHQNGISGKSSPPLINSNIPPPPKFMSKPLDVEPNTTTYVPVTDSSANIDKSDPNVKKLVYNTYRGLLGAYNNKANNMVTMPKNRVVQDQGVTKQLESMELQGCLDKLNGRVNPSGENE